MYFPTATAQSYVTRNPLNDTPTKVIDISANENKTLFCVLTGDTIAVWRVRPAVLLAHIARSQTSLDAHGLNKTVLWSPDAQRLVVLTNTSHLVLVNVDSLPPNESPYASPSLTSNIQLGPGEGYPLTAVSLRFEGVVQIDGDALWQVDRPLVPILDHLPEWDPAYLLENATFYSQHNTQLLYKPFPGLT
ncbi:hypothetical protein FRC08_002870 [Ceratobasidium sp. 394]|nr:hypothetical protein FRC08_002870 [Ceratobasidium sp. 394]